MAGNRLCPAASRRCCSWQKIRPAALEQAPHCTATRQLKDAYGEAADPDNEHRVRILAKRLRYGIEALRPLLAKRVVNRWYPQATRLQLSLGAARDVRHASAIVEKLGVDRELVYFLRGFSAGQLLGAKKLGSLEVAQSDRCLPKTRH